MTRPADAHEPLIQEITLRNLLSFGPETSPLRLGVLNVLIGPNGSGKSNLLDAIALLRATPGDMSAVIRKGGGVGEWVWKGEPDKPAHLDAVVTYTNSYKPLRHTFGVAKEQLAFRLNNERIENEEPNIGHTEPYLWYGRRNSRLFLKSKGEERELALDTITFDRSILAQRRDPDSYPEISYLASMYERICIYREWCFGRNTVFRLPQPADMRTDRLEEDFSNLGLYLNRLRRTPRVKKEILDALGDLYEGVHDFDVSVEAGTVQVFFTEGDFTIPATRLSDGTLRYLALVAILCDPEPPPLICIEEPELGLHPDILPKLAELLVKASARTQLIVTTHSDILVDAMTERPEAVIVCEKHDGQTTMRRLDSAQLAGWLEKYTLGQLWTRGELGGTRW